jgi:colanic acid biosynthesis glycosyl transferase WcaI
MSETTAAPRIEACPALRATSPTAGPAPASHGPRRIIFVNRFFFPDRSATSQILGDLAFCLAECGHDVRVIASRQRYDDPRARLPRTETIGRVSIDRLTTTRFGRSALLGQGFDYVTFVASVRRSVLASSQAGDVLVAMTDPPLLCVAAMRAARRRGLRLVNWLQDLYPEVATRLGVPLMGGLVGHATLHLRDLALRAADANIVVGDAMADVVEARGVPADRIHVIPNWCDDQAIRPIGLSENPLRREWGLEDRFVIGYSGNLGRAHEFETILAAAEYLRDIPRIVFLFIGSGNKMDQLARRVKEQNLCHIFRFLPYQERSALKYSLGVADIHLISLNSELEGLVVPSKLYGIAAAGRPIVAVTAKDGEIARLLQRYRCGIVIEQGQGRALGEALVRFSNDPVGLAEMGRCARMMLEERFTRRHAFDRWRSLFETMTAEQSVFDASRVSLP